MPNHTPTTIEVVAYLITLLGVKPVFLMLLIPFIASAFNVDVNLNYFHALALVGVAVLLNNNVSRPWKKRERK